MSRDAVTGERLEAFYRRVETRSPQHLRVSLVVLGCGVFIGLVLCAKGEVLAGCAVMGGAGLVGRVAVRWSGEWLRTGALRWSHKARGEIEIELLEGGVGWRRDLEAVARQSVVLGDTGWRELRVVMVTAVFPQPWLRQWGFEVTPCTAATRREYASLYRLTWWRWWLQARARGRKPPRYRGRPCVVARHTMGAWMDVVLALGPGLRRARPGRGARARVGEAG